MLRRVKVGHSLLEDGAEADREIVGFTGSILGLELGGCAGGQRPITCMGLWDSPPVLPKIQHEQKLGWAFAWHKGGGRE